MKKISLSLEEFGTLAICAIRYCQGRQTYMPDLVREIVRPHLGEMSNKDVQVLIDDCDFQEKMQLYGDPVIDKPGWVAWKKELQEEADRRKTVFAEDILAVLTDE